MGREVRMVPADWEHPEDRNGYRGLHRQSYNEALADWNLNKAKWDEGLVPSYTRDNEWVPRDATMIWTFEEYCGRRPSPYDYMPDWKPEERTHFMMYETTTEGTPISPAFATAEELARWLTDNNASAFADMTCTYEQWLGTIRRGSSISAVITDGVLQPGTVLNEK